MSTTIDERVVEMRFDNKNFESNVSDTINSIDKLNKSLNSTGATKGLEGMSDAATTVGLRFNAMYTIADQALRNITNSAMMAGKRIVSALTIDPVKTGFQEYETQINAVQTILANTESKGKTLTDVNKALDELNTYADKTIYNFTEMTRNIGTFTAAGVDLDTSVSAIKGIANLAAVSGSTSQQASTAMYQLSQALASGTVKLMDWNSVVNAGMGGQVFQDALKETARVHGIAIDDMISKDGSFRETLKNGWLTSEILTETLAKFTGDLTEEQLKSMGYTDEQIKGIIKMGKTANDAATKVKTFTQLFDTLKEAAQSGWTQTWEIIVGDFEEAKELLTKISDVVGGVIERSAKARNELLENWKVLGGRKDLIESFKNVFEGIVSIIQPIKEAFREIFPPMTAERLVAITKGLKDLTAKFKLSDKASENLKRTFKGLFAIVDIGKELLSAVFKAVGSLFGVFGDLGGGILGVTATFGDWLVKLRDAIKSGDIFNKVLQSIVSVIKFVANAVKSLINIIKEKIISPAWEKFHAFLERIHDKMSGVGEAAEGMKSKLSSTFESIGNAFANSSIFKLLQTLWKGITTVTSKVFKVLGTIIESFVEKIGNGDFQGFFDLINSIISGGVGIALIQFFNNLKKPFEGLGDILEGVTDILDSVRGCFEAYQTKLKADALMKIASAIAILAASLLVLSFIPEEKLNSAISAITVLFAELLGSMAIFTKISGEFKGVTKACFAMIFMSTAVLILASALKKISTLETDELARGLLGVAGLMTIVVATIKALNTNGKTVIKGALKMVIFAAAIKILASVCEDLSILSWEELAKGLLGVAGLLAAVSLFMNTAKFSGKSITTATGIVILAAAMKVLASVCEEFSNMSWGDIGKGLAAIAGLLAEIAIFTNTAGKAKHVLSTGIALIAIAAAMKIFVSAINDLSHLSWEELGKGLLGMAGALTGVTLALNAMPRNMFGKGIGLIAISSALLIMANAMGKMGGMSWEEIAKGLVTLGGAMLILEVGLRTMQGTLGGSAALIVAVAALSLFVPVLSILGAMSWKAIAKGLVSIAGAFLVIGIAGRVLKPIVPTLVGLAGSFALIGVAILALGVGLMAIGAGLSAIAIGFGALVTAIVGGATSIVAGLTVIITGIANLIPLIIKKIGEGIVEFCRVISNGIPAIADAIKAIVISVLDVLLECVPKIVDVVLEVIVGVLDSLVRFIPKIVDSLFKLIIGIIDGLAKNMPDLIKSVVNLVMSIFDGVVQALKGIDPKALMDGIKGVGIMTGLVAALAAVSSLIPMALAGAIGLGAVMAELAIVIAAVGVLAQLPGLEWLIKEGGNLLQALGTAIGQFIGGLAGGIAQGFTNSLPQIANDLSIFMDNLKPFIEGAKLIDPSVVDGVKALVGVIVAITGASILEGIASWVTGESSITQFSEELPILGAGLKGFSDTVAGVVPENIKAAAEAAKALAEMTSTIPNEGGVVSWFAGENSISKFGTELPILGQGLKGFSDAVAGISAENIIAASNAAKALAEMTSVIPNEGGVVSWFAGENSISKFGEDLPKLGKGLKGFSDAVAGIVPENIVSASNAAKALAEMSATIPDEGGVVSWFAGENSISKFAEELSTLGKGLKAFSVAVTGVVPENIVAAANAAKALAEMTAVIPNEGGIKAWFSGESSVVKFANDIPKLGDGLKKFSESVSGIVVENVTAGTNAAKKLADMASVIPKEGGMKAWFAGDASVSKFADQLPKLGKGLKGFSDAIAGIVPENITSAASSAKALADMTSVIPSEGGIKAWFTGESSISSFAKKLPGLGEGLKGFSDSVAGISTGNITAAANAAKSLGQMADTIPGDTDDIVDFGDNLASFGKKLNSYFSKVKDISNDTITKSKTAIEAVKKASEVDSGKVSSTAKSITNIAQSLKDLAKVPKNATSSFTKALKELGEKCSKALVEPFKDADEDMKKAGKAAVNAFADGVESGTSTAKKACKSMINDCVSAIKDSNSKFTSAGKSCAKGFADGISQNSFKAEAKASAMAKAAAESARKALKINSPSKVFRDIAYSIPEGFALGIDKRSRYVTDSTESMAAYAINGVRETLHNIAKIIGSDMDTQPTIRPVLDLSDVRAGASDIGNIFGTASVGLMANTTAINSMMNKRNQNGSTDEIVSAIDGLRKDLGNVGNTYNSINGVTYDDGSNIAEAIKTIIQAAKVERRV